ncbi:MAG: cytochrome c biogenesis protein CcdA [Methanolinea sp.]
MKPDRSDGKAILLFILLASVLVQAAYATEGPATEGGGAIPVGPDHRFSENGPVVVMFYNTHCGDCMRTLPFVQEWAGRHPELEIHLLDIKENFEYWKLFAVYKEAYATGSIPVPAVFVGDRFLVGYEEITTGLEDAVREQEGSFTSPLAHPVVSWPVNLSAGELTIPVVIVAGLADGINPCAFSVLILLLVGLSCAGSRKRMVLAGICFIGSVFVFYFLSGLGLFYVVQSAGISRAIGILAAGIAFLIGAASLYEGLTGGRVPGLAIPESRKGIIGEYIGKASVPASLVLGILVGMFELPCTGGIYLAILSLIADKMTIAEGIPLLLVYNASFVLPLVLILAGVTLGVQTETLDRWRVEHRRAVRVVMGLVLVGLGVLLAHSLLA